MFIRCPSPRLIINSSAYTLPSDGAISGPGESVEHLFGDPVTPSVNIGTRMVIELATQPIWNSSNINSVVTPSTKIQGPILNPVDLTPIRVPERESHPAKDAPGNLSSLIRSIDGIAVAIESLEMNTTTNDIQNSFDDNDETDNEESWSSVGEKDFERPHLDIMAREEAELTLEKFWDFFNKYTEKICRQRVAGDQQAPSSIDNGHESGNTAGSSLMWNRSSSSKSHQRLNDDEDDGRAPKRRRIEPELPPDRIENSRYSCPYRKHNRERYSIHTHKTCALSWFPTIARVK